MTIFYKKNSALMAISFLNFLSQKRIFMISPFLLKYQKPKTKKERHNEESVVTGSCSGFIS